LAGPTGLEPATSGVTGRGLFGNPVFDVLEVEGEGLEVDAEVDAFHLHSFVQA
jgi:hypothetical protein